MQLQRVQFSPLFRQSSRVRISHSPAQLSQAPKTLKTPFIILSVTLIYRFRYFRIRSSKSLWDINKPNKMTVNKQQTKLLTPKLFELCGSSWDLNRNVLNCTVHLEQTEQMLFEVLALADDTKYKMQMEKSCLSSAVKTNSRKPCIEESTFSLKREAAGVTWLEFIERDHK